MITDKQIIDLACATLDQGLDFSRSRITRATNSELIRFAQEVIDAVTVELRKELEDVRKDLSDTRLGWAKEAQEHNELMTSHKKLTANIELILTGGLPPTLLQLEAALLQAQRVRSR